MTRIMLPFLAIVSLAAVAMGMLNAQDRYAWPALAPATFNVVSIAVGVGLYVGGVEGRWVALGWSIGTVAGGMCQLLIQLPALRRLGYRIRPRVDLLLKDPDIRRVGLLMLPAVGGLAAVQINIVVNTILATREAGAVAWLSYSFRFLQLPIGVFGVAIATVSTTRYADAAADRDRESMAGHLHQGLRLVMFLTVPATVGLILLGEPIIRLIFERGAFEPKDTEATAAALEWFAVGLVAYAAIKVTAPAFYAINRARFPMIASIAAVIGNVTLALSLFDSVGYRILALGIAVAAIANFAVLYVAFNAVIHKIRHLDLLVYLLRISVAAAVMAAAVWGSYRGLTSLFGEESLWARLVVVMAPVIGGAVVYAATCWVLRIEELEQYTRRLRRRR
jgi:putative peptidoglycan lipid II flippase